MQPSAKPFVVIIAALIAIVGSAIYLGSLNYVCSCGENVRVVLLYSATLYSGPLPAQPNCSTTNSAYIKLSLYNRAPDTSLSSFLLWNGTSTWYNSTSAMYNISTAIPIATYYLLNGACTQITSGHQSKVPSNVVTNATLYFGSGGGQGAPMLSTNTTYGYLINFANGQSVSVVSDKMKPTVRSALIPLTNLVVCIE